MCDSMDMFTFRYYRTTTQHVALRERLHSLLSEDLLPETANAHDNNHNYNDDHNYKHKYNNDKCVYRYIHIYIYIYMLM